MPSYLETSLNAVSWNNNIVSFLQQGKLVERVEACNRRLAIWSAEIQTSEADNPALPFVREMQSAGFLVAGAVALGLYKAAAGSLRSLVETALYFSFFRTHPRELVTLVTDIKYYVSKRSIIEYHKQHTIGFSKRQSEVGFQDNLDGWYSRISAIVHGQIPGVWSARNLSDTAYVERTCRSAIKEFEEATRLTNLLFLLTCGQDNWGSYGPDSKKNILKGMPGKHKIAIGLPAV